MHNNPIIKGKICAAPPTSALFELHRAEIDERLMLPRMVVESDPVYVDLPHLFELGKSAALDTGHAFNRPLRLSVGVFELTAKEAVDKTLCR